MRKKRLAGNSPKLFPPSPRSPRAVSGEESLDAVTWLENAPMSQPIVLAGGFALLAALFAWLALAGLRTDAFVDRPPPATPPRPTVGEMGDGASADDPVVPANAGRPAEQEAEGSTQRESDGGSETANAPAPADTATPSAPRQGPPSSVPDDF